MFIYLFGSIRTLLQHRGLSLHDLSSFIVALGLHNRGMSLVAPWHMGLSYPTRDQTHDPCIARRILNHWTTREVPGLLIALAHMYHRALYARLHAQDLHLSSRQPHGVSAIVMSPLEERWQRLSEGELPAQGHTAAKKQEWYSKPVLSESGS